MCTFRNMMSVSRPSPYTVCDIASGEFEKSEIILVPFVANGALLHDLSPSSRVHINARGANDNETNFWMTAMDDPAGVTEAHQRFWKDATSGRYIQSLYRLVCNEVNGKSTTQSTSLTPQLRAAMYHMAANVVPDFESPPPPVRFPAGFGSQTWIAKDADPIDYIRTAVSLDIPGALMVVTPPPMGAPGFDHDMLHRMLIISPTPWILYYEDSRWVRQKYCRYHMEIFANTPPRPGNGKEKDHRPRNWTPKPTRLVIFGGGHYDLYDSDSD